MIFLLGLVVQNPQICTINNGITKGFFMAKVIDYTKIALANERNEHVTKRLNRLNTWKFFMVLYRENPMRLFGFNFLMILCLAPIFLSMILGTAAAGSVQQSMPLVGGFGFGTGAWKDALQSTQNLIDHSNMVYGWYTVLGALFATFMLSGGLAVIRDGFWTGKLSAVGVFKSMGKGISANFFYAFTSVALIASSINGIVLLYKMMASTMAPWLAIVLLVLLCIVELFVVLFLLILCSVSVTYKQSLAQNLADSYRLLFLNVLPNIVHLLFALLPIPIYLVFGSGFLQMIVMFLLMMAGGLYFPLVWQTHMMKTFALFHPVEVKKKKGQATAQAR